MEAAITSWPLTLNYLHPLRRPAACDPVRAAVSGVTWDFADNSSSNDYKKDDDNNRNNHSGLKMFCRRLLERLRLITLHNDFQGGQNK